MPLTNDSIGIMLDIDAAYTAGLFDGEGSVCLARLSHHIWNKRQDFMLKVRISNTRKPVLDWVKQIFGGSVHVATRKPTNGHNVVYQWCIHNVQAVAFLRTVYPYLRIKGPQADVAFRFQSTKEVVGEPRRFIRGVPPEITVHRFALYEELKRLNARGTTPIA